MYFISFLKIGFVVAIYYLIILYILGTLFTCILLMRALNDVKFQDTIREYMGHLKEIDITRKNYYNDLGKSVKTEFI